MHRFYLLLLLFFSVSLSFGQTWKELDDSVNALYGSGDYKTGLDFAQKEVSHAEKEFGTADSNYATSVDNLAVFMEATGNYPAAEPLFKQAMSIRKKALGEEHSDYATSLNNLASLYEFIGNYAEAEPLYKRASEIYKKVLGEDHPNYAISLNNLAGVYEEMGNYPAAERLHKEALAVCKKVFGEEHPEYAQSLHNLAVLYANMGNYAAAEPLFKRTLEIRKKILGEEHPHYAQSLNNLGDLYKDMGNYTAAEPLLKQALEIRKKILGPEHPDYAQSLDDLASLYLLMGKYGLAESLYKQTLEIRKKVLGDAHPDYAITLNGLGALYERLGNYPAAEPLYLAAEKIHKAQALQQLGFLSEAEQEKYFYSVHRDFETFQSFSLKCYRDEPTISSRLNDMALFGKGLQLKSGIAMRQKILGSGDTALVNLFNRWTEIKQMLSKLYSLPINDRFADVATLETQANEMEKQLTRSSQVFKEQREKQSIETADVQAKLGKEEAAIEFISFNYNNGEKWTDSVMYVALVLRPGMNHPALIPLFEEKQLDILLNTGASINNLYLARGLHYNNTTIAYGSGLYNLIWSKIEPELKGVKSVYYSPSGQLNRIAFAALPVDSTKLLSDKYNLVLLSSTAEIVNKHNDNFALNSSSTVALFGGIKYDESVSEMQTAARKTTIDSNALALAYNGLPSSTRGDISRGSDWTYLPGTLSEVKQINAELIQKNIIPSLYTGSIATEDILRTLQGKNAPTVLHIATHGFFFPEKKDTNQARALQLNREELASTSENPLLRTGLILTGGNNKWKNDTLQMPDGLNDGILTAYDVSNMDLSITKLAVLSACQTGLGDIKGSEGVYGMQRAFKMAGVDYLIVSLWSVPDEAAQEFMTHFYSRWAENGNLQKAFEETQQMMRKKYKDPYNWAAFVLMR